jgi:integrase
VSIERISRKRGTGWRVRWRDGSRNRARIFDRKADAVAFEAETRRRRFAGDLRPFDAGRETLQEFAEEWWRLYAVPNLARTTLASYASLWDAHVLPRLGATPLRELDPLSLAAFRAELTASGVGPASTRRVMVILQGVLERAVEWQRIPANPARSVRKPAQRRERAVRPLSPLDVEGVRAYLLDCGRPRDAVVVSVLAYAGLRPGEALALAWSHIRERTILVECAVALGDLKTTKTARTRTVRLLAPLAADLLEWRIRCGRPDDDALVFPSRQNGLWSDDAWRYWRRRIFAPAARAAGLGAPVRPYDLRHSFVSLLLAEGANVVEIARQAGHSPTMTLSTYAHLFDEASGGERLSAEDEIRRARRAVQHQRRTRFVPETRTELTSAPDKEPANPGKPTRGLEPRTPSLRGTAGVGRRVARRAVRGSVVLRAARIAVDCLGRLRTAIVEVMHAESTRGLRGTTTT